MATIKDIAQAAGVSLATVSRDNNGQKRAMILQACQKIMEEMVIVSTLMRGHL